MNKCANFQNLFFIRRIWFSLLFFHLCFLPSDILKFVCLSFWINTLAINHIKKLSNVKNLEYVFLINNLRSYFKNCDRIFGTFYRATSKSFWIIIQPFLLNEFSDFHNFFVEKVIKLFIMLTCDSWKCFGLSVFFNICFGEKLIRIK